VTGRYGVCDGTWIDPVTAQVTMTLRDAVAIAHSLLPVDWVIG
jgi:hypothetical protein